MNKLVLKVKSIPSYDKEIILHDVFVNSDCTLIASMSDITKTEMDVITNWYHDVFTTLRILKSNAEIIEYSKDDTVSLIVNVIVVPICISNTHIEFDYKIIGYTNFKDRQNISWDEYFSNLAVLTSLRSKDTTKVGAVLVSQENKVLSLGYNGYVKGVDESIFPKNREAENLSDTKYPYVIHAEANCILNLSTLNNIKGSILYCTLFPCCDCAKLLANAGVSKIIYISDKYHDEQQYIASRRILDASNIEYLQYDGNIYVNKN